MALAAGDLVMFRVNDKLAGIDNGQLGRVSSIDVKTDAVIVKTESGRVATAETAYVAASRETLGLEIITDNIARLSAAWATWSERIAATSLRAVKLERPESQQARADIVRTQAAARQAEIAAAKARELPKLEPEPPLERPSPGMSMGR
jgi:hypothetical protein